MSWCRGHCGVGVGVARGLYIRGSYGTSSFSSLLYIGPPKLSHCRSQNPSQRPPFYGIDNDDYQRSYPIDKEFTYINNEIAIRYRIYLIDSEVTHINNEIAWRKFSLKSNFYFLFYFFLK